jgi:CRP-like cAMP-binding protein/cytochrome c-type biogenesis protein CcmH/NrfG/GTPase SAR1 family protein
MSGQDIFTEPDRIDEFTTRFPEQVRTMLAMLRLSRLGGIAVAECDDLELRQRLFTYFRSRLADEGLYLYLFEVSDADLNLVHALRDLTDRPSFKGLELTGKYRGIIIFIYGIEKYSEEQQARFLHLLNFLRDRLTLIEQPVVIWGTHSFITKMARSAPDFWSWKGMVFSFVSPEAAEVAVGVPPALLPPLTRYLNALLEDPDYTIWRDLYLPLKAIYSLETSTSVHSRHKLTASEIASLAQAFPARRFEAGSTVCERGETGATCYVIQEGQVEVLVPDSLGDEVVITALEAGDFFGEISLLRDVPRTATVCTTEECYCIEISRGDVPRIVELYPAVAEVIEQIGQQRLERRRLDLQEFVSPFRRFALEGRGLIQPKPIDVLDLIGNNQRLVVLGEAGAGKTTVLRRALLDLTGEGEQQLRRPGGRAVIPFFVKLNLLTPDRQVEELILDTLHAYGLYEFESTSDLQALLDRRHPERYPVSGFVFLLDGLNEIPGGEVSRRILNQFIRRYYKDNRFIIACRTEDYSSIQEFRAVALQPLGGQDIETYLVKYLGEEQGRRVAVEIHGDAQLLELGQNPLALYMFAQIAKTEPGVLPKNRGVLFRRFTDNLLERTDTEWWKIFGRSKARVPLELRRRVLSWLGLMMHEQQVRTYPRQGWEKLIKRGLNRYQQLQAEQGDRSRAQARGEYLPMSAQDVFEEVIYSGLLRLTGDRGRVEFLHNAVQEFFAALSLRGHERDIEEYLQTARDWHHWQGVLVLLFGISAHQAELFRIILGPGDDYERIWVAADCLANAGGDVAMMVNRLREVLQPERHFALFLSAGLACRELGRYTEALNYLNEAVNLRPSSADAHYELGSIYRQIDQYERAITALEEAIHLRPDFVDAYNQLGITYYDQGHYEEALTFFQATTQLEPRNPYHFYNQGYIHKLLHSYEAAAEAFRQALHLKADYSEASSQLEIVQKALDSGVVAVLKDIPLLSKLTLEQCLLISNRLKLVEAKAGEIIFHLGEIGDIFYIIETGQVEILAPDIRGQQSVINRLTPGDFFGEIALLRAVPRTATVRATCPTRLLSLSREAFDEVVRRYPSIATSLAETSRRRILQDWRQNVNPELRERLTAFDEFIEAREVTVLIADIHGSTVLTDAVGPEKMMLFLDEFLLRLSNAITESGGTVDRSLGDSVMGVFSTPPKRPYSEDTGPSSGVLAVMSALQMRKTFLELREEWSQKSSSFEVAGLGIGLSTGKVAMGTVGTEKSTVGPPVNMAAKLSKLVTRWRQECEIYVDEPTRKLAGDAVVSEQVMPDDLGIKIGGTEGPVYHIIVR